MARWFEQKFDGDDMRQSYRRQRMSYNLSYTTILIGINVVSFIMFLLLLSIYGEGVLSYLALVPSEILAGRKLWTFLTSMFIHSPTLLIHIIFNMVTLMFIGGFVEKLIGKKRFLWLYFGGGLAGGLFFVVGSVLMKSNLNVAGLGASGAIFALGGLLAVLTPRLPVLVMFIIPMPMWVAMGVLMFGIWAFSLLGGWPIANSAHFGGLIVGVGYGFYLKWKYPRKTQMISKYFAR